MADIPNDFPWRPGMLTTDGYRVLAVDSTWLMLAKDDGDTVSWWPGGPKVDPDLTDPATLGALLGAVREAWRSPSAHTRQRGTIRTDDNRIVPAWEVCDLYLDDEGARAIGASKRGGVQCALLLSEADALLAAWNARPRPT